MEALLNGVGFLIVIEEGGRRGAGRENRSRVKLP